MFTEAQTEALIQLFKTQPTVAAQMFELILGQEMTVEERDQVQLLRAYFTNTEFRGALEQMTWNCNLTA